ncbi:MAG: hypothetical protein ACI9OW_000280 [Marinobacter psychrophilus]|jgi:hypothetical protein
MKKELAALKHLFPARKDSPRPAANMTFWLQPSGSFELGLFNFYLC